VSRVRERLLLLILSVLVITGFAISTELLELVPQNSSFVLLLNDNAGNYDMLKSVPIFSTLLSDLGLELMIQQQLEIYRYSQNIDLDRFYQFLSHGMAFYVTDGGAGLVAGPFEDPEKVAEALSQIAEAFEVSLMTEPTGNYLVVTVEGTTTSEKKGFQIPATVLKGVPSNAWGVYYGKKENTSETYGWFAVEGNVLKGRGVSHIEDKALLKAVEEAPSLSVFEKERVLPDLVFAIAVPGDVLNAVLEGILEKNETEDELARELLENVGKYLLVSGMLEVSVEQDQQEVKPWVLVRLNTTLEKAKFEEMMKKRGYAVEAGNWVAHLEDQVLYFNFDEERSEILLAFEPPSLTKSKLEEAGIPLSNLMERLSIPKTYRGLIFVDTGSLLEKFIGLGVESHMVLTTHQEGDTIVSEFTLR